MGRRLVGLLKRVAGGQGAFGAGKRSMLAGDWSTAAEAFAEAEQIYTRQLGPQHAWVVQAIAYRAWCLFKQGSLEESASLYQRALELESNARGDFQRRTGELSRQLAVVFQAMGKSDEAHRLNARADAIKNMT